MLITLGQQGTAEYSAAEELGVMFRRAWPWIDGDHESHVYLLAGVQCHGQAPRDIDLVVLAILPGRPQFQAHHPPDASSSENEPSLVSRVVSLCIAIEVKDHDPRSVRIRGTEVEVAYTGPNGVVEWKSATHQSERQKYSLKNYLGAHLGSSPWVSNLIWLRNVGGRDIPQGPSNILPSRFTLNGFLNKVAESTRLVRDGEEFLLAATRIGEELPIQRTVDFLTVSVEPTTIDRIRMDRIVRESVEKRWLNDPPTRQLIFRGRGGTGKTMLLLQIAWHMNSERGRKVLLLTYNHALLADLRRLMTMLGISDDLVGPRLQVHTVHSYFYSVLSALGVLEPGEDFLDRYEGNKEYALQCINGGALAREDIDAVMRKDPDTFEWDRILVDEGQDWPQNEMQLLRLIYGPEKLVVADGLDQLVRQDCNCDWVRGLHPDEYEVVGLHSGLRMKRNLAVFANSLAVSLGLTGWEVRPNKEATGGKVIVVEGDYFKVPDLHKRLVREATFAGNDPVDMLACVPPSMVQRDSTKRCLSIEPKFLVQGQPIWDGTNAGIRSNTYPLSTRQLRIVQYDSCRGLEGWTCINLGIDEFFDYKASRWSPPGDGDSGGLLDLQDNSQRYASRWLMIPLTRAMDTLVIQLHEPTGFLGGLIRNLATGPCKDFMELIQ